MASGVGVNEGVTKEFQALKLGRTHKYLIFNLSKDLKEIVVEKCGESKDYEVFLKDLPETECRWAIYDLEFDTAEGRRNKLIFVSWSPDDAKIKQKMLFASSRDALRRQLVGIAAEVQATDFSEVAFETVKEKASKGR